MSRKRRYDHVFLIAIAAFICCSSGCASICCQFAGDVHGELTKRLGYGLPPRQISRGLIVPHFVDLVDGVSEEEAVVLALWNNPAYQQLLADLDIAQADLMQAGQLTNPQLSTMIPVGPKQWEFALLMPLDVLVLRPHRVCAAQLEAHRVAERLVQDGLNVVRDVRVAFADLDFAERQLDLTREGDRLRSEVARIAEARLKAGAVAELDVAAIRLESMFSQDAVKLAERDSELARERLRYLLGAGLVDCRINVEPAEMPNIEQWQVEDLVQESVASRPDILALELAIDAASELANLRRFDYLNINAVLPDANGEGEKGFEAGPGLQMNIPLFHRNQGARARACAELERLRRTHANLRETVALEVRQAHIRLMQSEERRRLWHDQVVPQSAAAVTATRKALEEDAISLLLVLENTRQYVTAQQRELEAAAESRRAIAELERSVGRQLIQLSPTPASPESIQAPGIDAGGLSP